jgi:hypothetical protein
MVLAAGCKGGGGDSSATSSAASAGGNAAPTIGGTASTSLKANAPYSFTPTASDANGDTLSFQIENKPAWATFNTVTGLLSGTPTVAQIGTYSNILISASDGRQSASLPAFTLTVGGDSPKAVTLQWTAPTENVDGSALTDLGGFLIAYGTSEDALTQTISIDNASVSEYTIEDLAAGTYYIGIKAFNTNGMESDMSQLISRVVD